MWIELKRLNQANMDKIDRYLYIFQRIAKLVICICASYGYIDIGFRFLGFFTQIPYVILYFYDIWYPNLTNIS